MLLKKLINYNFDCVKELLKSSAFLNLKDESILKINTDSLNLKNQALNKMLIEQKKNKSVMTLFFGKYFIKNNFVNSPLLFKEVEIIQNGEKYIISDLSDFELNINLIINLCNKNFDYEFIINTLLNIDDSAAVAGVFEELTGIKTNKKDDFIILAKTPEAVAGVLNELKKICKEL